MITATTNLVDGKRAGECLGIVTGEAIIGANIFREMSHFASSRGADAAPGVDLDHEVLGSRNGMLMVPASGTAVKLGR